ncbi:hypothetical protein TEA_004288 [Camellia sinensis var. sinensis]|uniref:Uncharacterized protein n=1 Tax=Camellia sinensis var. sinensis TaxID=542762 RepID=A0A4S4E7C9_CAMSN|nr:hypothetical protein TEA_004288 [Camellia sinensis var. sinensis]
MELDGLPQLTCLWNKDPHGILGLQSLQYLTIKNCSLLRNLFTCSTAMALQQLKVLYLESCPVMEEVIAATNDGLKEVVDDVIEFPKLEWLILKDLSNLNRNAQRQMTMTMPAKKESSPTFIGCRSKSIGDAIEVVESADGSGLNMALVVDMECDDVIRDVTVSIAADEKTILVKHAVHDRPEKVGRHNLKNNLEVLSLRGSDVKALPSEIGQLTQLRLLDLRNCKKLSKIPQGVISNLSRLEELHILDNLWPWEATRGNKEGIKVNLDELRKLTQLTTLHIHIPDAMLLPKDICFENLIRFIISMGERFYYLKYQSSTRMFKLVGVPFRDEFNVLLERAEVLHLEKVAGLQVVYRGLYPSCARGLLQIQRLVIRSCYDMEGIVGNEGEKNEEAVTKRKIGDIKNLSQEENFDKVSHRKPPPQKLLFPSSADYVSLDYMSFDSRESVFKKIMDALKDSKVYKIGVHGLGGVGKTKMVEEVGKQVKKDGLFDEVVMAVVSQDANVSKIQLQLVGGLNPKPDVVTITDDHERAKKLWQRLDNGKKNLIILDDIFHELNLTTIGIPIKDRNKIVITSRNRDVWKNMEMDTEFQIKVLSETEAWALFKKKVGNSVDSPELHDIAKEVCKECQGLPVAILIVGGALKDKEKYVWKNALEKLKKCMLNKIEGISPKLYESMKLSYDYLSMDAKSCFLLCCMFPEDAEIPIDELVRHCTARGLLDQKPDTLEEARDAVHTVVDTLKTCSLLLDGTDKNVVKMHDVIRDVAVSVADDDKAILVKHGVHEWPEKGTYESYLAISLRSKTIHEVPNKLGSPQLHTLLLDCINPTLLLEYPSVIIPDMFFDGMEKLTVLELNGVRMLQLPPSLANLVNLRMLCLNECQLEDITILKDLKNNLEVLSLRGSDIKALPSEIGQLTQLRLLDLRNCKKLSKIPQGVISNLSRLEELHILDNLWPWEATRGNKEGSKVNLDELRKLTQLTTLHIHIPDAMLLPKDICFENLIRFIISMGERFHYSEYQSSVRMFKLVGVPLRDEFNVLLKRAEVLHLEKVEGSQKVYHGLHPSGSFNKLTELTIKDCKLKYLFSPSCVRGLLQIQQLVITDCEVMEGIVGNEGEENEEAVTSEAINFSQLKYMELRSLPSLVSFYPKMEKTSTAKENSSTQAHCLFNEKAIIRVETLSISITLKA